MTEELDSPTVAMVRKARREVADACGNDLKTLLAELRRMEQASGRKTGTPKRRKTRPQAK